MLEEALAEISEKENSLRAVFQHSNAGIFICTAEDYKLTFANDIFIDMLQVPQHSYHHVSILSYIGEKNKEDVVKQLKKMVEGQAGELRMDVLIDGDDDFQSWVDLSISPVLEKNNVRLLIGIAVDNTNKKIFKGKLDATEKRFRHLVDNLDDVVGLIDRDGKILYYNEAGLRYHKATAKDIYGKYFHDYYSPEDAEKIMEIKETAFVTKKVSRGVVRFKLYGEEYVVDLTAIPHFEKDGSVKRIQTIGKNITAQTKMMNELSKAQQGLELIMRSIPDIVYSSIYDVRDKHLFFEYLSPKVEEITGYPADVFLSQPHRYHQLIVPEDITDLKNPLEILQSGGYYRCTVRIKHKSGNIVEVSDNLEVHKIDDRYLRVTGSLRTGFRSA
ncbi:MAG: PAS domain-containing protein [Bacteroidales bacterium]